jgi:hypothetical protein
LTVDQDRDVVRRLGLACLDRGIGIAAVENVGEAVRVLLGESVSLIVVDASLLRSPARDEAALFERVAAACPSSSRSVRRLRGRSAGGPGSSPASPSSRVRRRRTTW